MILIDPFFMLESGRTSSLKNDCDILYIEVKSGELKK